MTATPVPAASQFIPNLLSIAGSDSSGGAGVQADLKTFALLGVNGAAVITSITAQNTRAVMEVLPVPPRIVTAQIDAVLDDMAVHAVKVGMLGAASTVRAVARALEARAVRPVVVDPILRASTGAALLPDDALAVLRDELFPLATLVTPNASEAGAILGHAAPVALDEMRDAARELVRLGPAWALVTGGHVDSGDDAVDVLSDGNEVHELRVNRVGTRDTHGTGCTLTAAIAALLALGGDVPTACGAAQRYVAASIAAAETLNAGQGRAPVRQLPWANAGRDVRDAMERPRRRWK